MFWDPSIIFLIPGLILAAWAQFKVKSTFARYSKVASSRRMNAAELAGNLLRRGGLAAVPVERVPGELTDHYDPRTRVLRLSDTVYGSNSVAALGVAAHEVGHALQHEKRYFPLGFRNSLVPVVSFASTASFPLILIGLFLPALRSLAMVGVIMFSAVVFFQLVTLPVEFNASRRAVALLNEGGYLNPDEIPMVQKVLGAAALTYVAAALVSFLNLVRFLFILGFFNNDD